MKQTHRTVPVVKINELINKWEKDEVILGQVGLYTKGIALGLNQCRKDLQELLTKTK